MWVECFIADAVPSFMLAQVDIPSFLQHSPRIFDRCLMLDVCSADEVVIRDVRGSGELLEYSGTFVGERLRVGAGGESRLLHFHAMFVGAGAEVGRAVWVSKEGEAFVNIGEDQGEEVADVRGGVDVEDGRGDVERLFVGRKGL